MREPSTAPVRQTAARRMTDGSRQERVCQHLEALAREQGPGTQLATIRQLQSDLGVSLATLDAALAELEQRQVIQRRQGSGIFVAPKARYRRLMLLCNPAILMRPENSPFWSQLCELARHRADAQEETLSIQFTNLDAPPPAAFSDPGALPERVTGDILRGRVHGVLAIHLTHAVTRWIEQQGVPVVAYAGPARFMVTAPLAEAVPSAVAELVRRGCRRLALFLRPDDDGGEERMAFDTALAVHGLDTYSVPAAPKSIPARQDVPAVRYGFRQMQRLLDAPQDEWPDGIVSTDDMLTQGALMALLRRGMLPGDPIQFATHANAGSPALLGWEDRLIRLEFDPAELVQAMFEMLETLIAGKTPERLEAVPPDPMVPDYIPDERFRRLHWRLITLEST